MKAGVGVETSRYILLLFKISIVQHKPRSEGARTVEKLPSAVKKALKFVTI
jgi:hypothetical protein